MTNIDGKHTYLHVKHKNARKSGMKMVQNTLFSDRQHINIKKYFRAWISVSVSVFPGSRTDSKRPYRHTCFVER